MGQLSIEKEFLDMVTSNEGIIFRVASFYTNTETPISDLYQEVVLNLWKSYPSFRGESKQSTWIYRIALNTCVSFYRRKKKDVIFVDIVPDIIAPNDMSDSIKELYRLIDKLGKIERALVLLYLDEKSYKEISEITGLTVTNVATKLARIKEKLKKMSNQ